MEDYKFIIYILLAVAYFIISNWRKFMKGIDDPAQPKKFINPNEVPEQTRPQVPTAPATSFEDIMRELQPKAARAKEQVKNTVETAKADIPTASEIATRYRNYDEEYAPRAYTDERLAEAREKSRKLQQSRREEAFVPYAKNKQQGRKSIAVELLRNPTSAREAFILSEIFQRKY